MTAPHRFDPARCARLERPERRAELRADALMAHLELELGMVVADVGCGTGLFTRAAAQAVGLGGRVHALDVEPEMLAALRATAPPPQVAPLHCPEDTILLPAASVDLILLAFVLHEAVDPDRLLEEAARVLVPSGRVACLEWNAVAESRGPPLEHRMTAANVAERMSRAGLHPAAAVPWTASHYLLLADHHQP